MRLIALDLSLTATGVVDPDGNPDTLHPPKGAVAGPRLAWWYQTFIVLFDQHHPDRLTIESPFVGHLNNTLKLGELYGVLKLALHTHGHGIVITWVPPSSLKKAWTGHGNADKDFMRLEAGHRGLPIDDLDDNAIDALALWHTTKDGHWDDTTTGDAA